METHISLTAGAQVSNAVLRAVHAALLSGFAPEQVREFWRPCREWFPELNEADFYRHVWNEEGVSRGVVFSDALSRFERYHYQNGKCIEQAVDALRMHVNRGSWVRAGVLLKRVHQVLPTLFTAKDPHRAVLRVIAANCELEFIGARTHLGKVHSVRGVNTVYGAVAPDPESRTPILYDGNLLASRLLQAAPLAFGLPAFEEPVLHIADCRPPALAVWDEPVEVRAHTLVVNGRAIGELVTFESFLDELGFHPPKWELERAPVFRVHEDYECPYRKRVVLQAGCVYGAPYYVCRFRWRPSRPTPKDYLGALSSEVAAPESEESRELEARHAALIAQSERHISIEYHTERDSICVAGVTLFTGTPARILRHILRRYAEEGTEVFEFRDFKYDREITRNPKQSGFEQRLQRISAKLAETDCLRITTAGRGRLRFTATAPVAFVERS